MSEIKRSDKPKVQNCLIVPRQGEILFTLTEDQIIPNLDGYAIVPREQYEQLLAGKK